jgi:hypothetical protein
MFHDPMFCQPTEPAPGPTLPRSASVKPVLVAVFVAWMLSLLRLVLAFARAELSADTLLALVFFSGLPTVGLALWLREQRTGRRRGAARAVAHATLGSPARQTHLHLVPTSSTTRRRGSPPDPKGTRAA